MAARYVYTGGSNTSPYDTWAKAATTLTTAITGSAAGDDFWVASDHAESTAGAVTLTFPGTDASPCRCISVSRAGSTPPVAADITAGASVTTTGANTITIRGGCYVFGVTFNAGSGASNASITINTTVQTVIQFDGCALNLVGTSSAPRINLGSTTSAPGFIFFNNTTVSFANTAQGMANGVSSFIWQNKPGSVAVTGATIPTKLLADNTVSGETLVTFKGLDMSASGSGKTLIGDMIGPVRLVNCKLGASVTVATTPSLAAAQGVELIGCSTTTNVSRNERYHYTGTLTTETTIIRTAGASDGTTSYSWKIVTTANSKRTVPFETFEGALWNTATGSSKTLTIHTVTDNVTLTDAEIWLEVEYLGSSATPVSTLITDANATVLTTAANQTSDSGEAWTTTGLTTPVKQALAVTFTPQMAGPIRWRVKVAKASATVYVCPNADLS